MFEKRNHINLSYDKFKNDFELIINGKQANHVVGVELCNRYDELSTIKIEINIASLNTKHINT